MELLLLLHRDGCNSAKKKDERLVSINQKESIKRISFTYKVFVDDDDDGDVLFVRNGLLMLLLRSFICVWW